MNELTQTLVILSQAAEMAQQKGQERNGRRKTAF